MDIILPNFKELQKYCSNLTHKYSTHQSELDLVITPTLTKCMFPIEDMPNMYGRDFDDDLKGNLAQDMWKFANTLKSAPECHIAKNGDITINVITMLNILCNMNNNGKGLIIS